MKKDEKNFYDLFGYTTGEQNYFVASIIIEKNGKNLTLYYIQKKKKYYSKSDETTDRNQPPLSHFWQTILADRDSHHRI